MRGKSVTIHHITRISLGNLQKITKAIFHRKKTRVAIYTTENNQETEKEMTTYGMIISNEEKSFKDILGKIKTIVGANSSAKAIRSVRRTKEGKLLLTIEKDETDLMNIFKALNHRQAEDRETGT